MIRKIPHSPLEKIALSCSGGGYRAASFHLGAMAYLNKIQYKGKPLLENVKLISTVSGGTITGVVYALKKQEGKSFEEFYHFLLGKLRTLDLIKLSLVKLSPEGGLKNQGKRKNLINAFAELYDEHFTEGAMFEVFDTMKSHLEVVVFNSTEFDNGVNFRFRNKGTGYFGNNYIRVNGAAAAEVKLADAMAASACFPGGFEPILWPNDFVHDTSLNLLEKMNKESHVTGLMDGGVYDNQGIQSILLHKKNEETPAFDLIIISDVASPYMQPFKPFSEKPKKGLRSLTLNDLQEKTEKIDKGINMFLLLATVLFLAIPFLWKYAFTFYTGLSLGVALTGMILMLVKRKIVSYVKEVVHYVREQVAELIPAFFRAKLAALRIEHVSVHRIEPLLFDRLNSLVTLLMDVFLKVVRRLNYGDLYNDEKFMYRRMSNLIKELTKVDFERRANQGRPETKDSKKYAANSKLNGTYDIVVGSKIQKLVEEAASFGTTLWFTDDNELDKTLDKLLATGRVTMCYNLLDYLEQLLFVEDNGFDQLDQHTQEALRKTYDECLKDWNDFKQSPMG